jgi:virginiamycin B lyase
MSKRLIAFLCLSCFLLLFSACIADKQSNSASGSSAVSTSPGSAQGEFAEYPLPQDHSSIMRPAVDHQGRVWFGEMGRNFLACFDPKTQTFLQITPPHGANGIMGIAIANDDTIWFAEQYANYIGHYFPTTHRYQVYDLPVLHKTDPSNNKQQISLPSAPNDLVLDKQGNVWFTEMNADAIGMLNVKTGKFTHYPISSPATIQVLDPYGITIDPQGDIWFTEASTNRLGLLEPKTGKIQHFTSASVTGSLMEVVSDLQGTIWATSFNSGLLLKFRPTTGQFTSYTAMKNGADVGGLYGLTIGLANEIWIAVTSGNAIARFESRTGHFVYYTIPTNRSDPLGIAMDDQHALWFTESSANKIGKLLP